MNPDEIIPSETPVDDPIPSKNLYSSSFIGIIMIVLLLLIVAGLQIGSYISTASSAREFQEPNIVPPSPSPTPQPTVDPCKTPTPTYIPLTKMVVSPTEPITWVPLTRTPTPSPVTRIASITPKEYPGIPWPTKTPTPTTTPCP